MLLFLSVLVFYFYCFKTKLLKKTSKKSAKKPAIGGPKGLSGTNEDEDEDDGGFSEMQSSSIPHASSKTYPTNGDFNEQSSLAMNKMSGSKTSLNSNLKGQSQLPILNLNSLPGNGGSGANITLSSATLSNRLPNVDEKKIKNLNDYTTSAHEFLTQSISQNALNHIDSSNGSTKNLNSPSRQPPDYSHI